MRPEFSRAWRAAAVAAGLIASVTVPSSALADSIRDRQWHVSALRLTEAHKISRGEGIIVAVVDSGVDAAHPDLAGSVLPGTDLGSAGDGRSDTAGHGTAMASAIAARGHGPGGGDGVIGVAPGARILPIRDQGSSGGSRGTGDGIRWAADHGAKIINISAGGADLSAVRSAVEYAIGKGIIVVAAAGNDGGPVEAPAMYPGVVAVAGTGRDGSLWPKSGRGREVVAAAPAAEIAGAEPGGRYSITAGTSDAAAITSGVLALVWAKFPSLDAANVINRLIKTADDKGEPGRDPSFGYGLVNPVRALTADVASAATHPLLPSAASPAPSAPASAREPGGPASSSDAARGGGNEQSPALMAAAIAAGALMVLAGGALAIFMRKRRKVHTGR
ncbi:S8 family serine peptidase [Longispora albida]|uniref:S8 family serine peptidase n=1 Tax=Longispora albida TaxID=203523 RepID=UPI0009FCE5A8|nr:S8 family serine peptidase [Longispora albida]